MYGAPATLESLTSTINAKVAALSKQLEVEGISGPTLAEAGHASYKGESPQLRRTRYDLARAAKTLLMLAQGPEDTVTMLAWSSIESANVDTLLRFNFFDAVPLDAPTGISAVDLATKVDLPVDITERMVRYAIGNGLFVELKPGVFGHSAASASLVHTPQLAGVARVATGPLTTITVRIADALELQQAGRKGVPAKVLSGQTHLGPEDPAFCLAFPDYRTPWELGHAEERFATIIHAFMRDEASTSRMRLEHLFRARDWSRNEDVKIVDVGGSLGHASIALASILPRATFLVQDANTTALDQGRVIVKEQFPQFSSRISFAQHDFFTPMPAESNGDLFLFQWILHDWSNTDAVRILKALVPGLKSGARVLIAEAIKKEPPAGLANTLDEKMVLFQDMTMLAAHNARERTVSQFVGLFREADPRFHHVATGGGMDGAYRSLLEFEFRA